MTSAPQTMKTPQLMEEYRGVLLALGAKRGGSIHPGAVDEHEAHVRDLSRRADALESEINRRIAWG